MLRRLRAFLASPAMRGQAPVLRDWRLIDITLAVTFALAVGAIALVAVRFLPFVAAAEQWLVDARLIALTPGNVETHPRIVIVAITEETLQTLPYRSPVDRQFLATLLDTLHGKGVNQIAVDFLFDQPTDADKDDALLRSINQFDQARVIGWADVEDRLTAKQQAFLSRFFESGGAIKGWVTLIPDSDGTVRSYYPGRIDPTSGQWVPSFAGAVAQVNGQEPPRTAMGLAYSTRERLSDPVFEVYEAQTIADLPDALFKDKIVLIGVDLPEDDRHRTPFATLLGHTRGSLPGVVIQAHAISQLLSGRVPPTISPIGELVAVLVAVLLATMIALIETTITRKLAAVIVIVALYWVAGGLSVVFNGPLLALVSPTLATFGAFAAASAYIAQIYRDKKTFIRDAFSRYVEPSVVEQLLRNPNALNTEGELKEVTLLFTDVERFTSFAEATEPTVLVRVMSGYFDIIAEAIIDAGGTLDKFVGDGAVAIFNAPVPIYDHARRAVDCAVRIGTLTERYRESVEREHGITMGHTRIGVHTGYAVVGNFGSQTRKNYTAMGDAVNTASRLESANKVLGTRICISHSTVVKCGDRAFLPVGNIDLRGRTERIDVWMPISAEEAKQPITEAYRRAFSRLQNGDPGAEAEFAAIVGQNAEHPLARLHLARLRSGDRRVGVGVRVEATG